jgi:hypothetical protein
MICEHLNTWLATRVIMRHGGEDSDVIYDIDFLKRAKRVTT